MDSSQFTAWGDQHSRVETKYMFDNNRLQQLKRRSRAPAKATCSQQSGIHIEPKKLGSTNATTSKLHMSQARQVLT